MKFTVPVTIGDKTYIIEDTAESITEFWQKASFWDSLPTEAPGGATDLKLQCRNPLDRKTGKKVRYYSIVSTKERKEFKMGIHMDDPKSIFPKGWTDWRGGGDQHEEEEQSAEAEAEAEAEKPAQPQEKKIATGNAASNVLQIENRPLTDEQMNRLAREIVAGGGVSRTAAGYDVRINPKTVFQVTSQNGSPVCNCERFKPGTRCPHIRAVAIWTSQPAKPDTRNELKLLIMDCLDAGFEAEDVDAFIARVCDGKSAVETLDAAQIAKALRSLGQKLEERKLKKAVSQ